MKFPGFPLLFIFVVILTNFSGCISTPALEETSPLPTTEPVTSTPEMTVPQLATPQLSESAIDTLAPVPADMGIIVDSSALMQLILQQTDFPSFVVSSKGQFGSAEKMEKDPSNPSVFYGYQNGYLLEVVLEKDGSKVSQLVAITDIKVNASKTYDQLDTQLAPALQIQNQNMSVTASSVPIGDRGKMYVFNATQYQSVYYLFFTRGNVFELIVMEVPPQSSSDAKVITDIAKNAYRRITFAQQPVPITSSTIISIPYPTTILPERPTIVTPVPTNPTVIGNMITIKNFAFDPSYIIVKNGTVVTWLNQDEALHTIVTDTGSPAAFFSGSLSNGNFYELRFNELGTYPYHCSIHPSMKGIIVVQN